MQIKRLACSRLQHNTFLKNHFFVFLNKDTMLVLSAQVISILKTFSSLITKIKDKTYMNLEINIKTFKRTWVNFGF